MIRVFHTKSKGKKLPHYKLKCGCCNEELEVFYDEDNLEINGVNGSVKNWREVLLPLLGIKDTETEFRETNPLKHLRKKYSHVGN